MAWVACCLCVLLCRRRDRALFVCLSVAACRERTRPATHPGGFARRTSIPSASSPRTPRRSRRCRPRSPARRRRPPYLLFVCVASMAWPCVVCLLWLFVCRVCRGSMRENSCLCVVVVCRVRASRLDERIRSATHPGGFAQAPARPPRHARRRGHDRPGAPDGRHALLSAKTARSRLPRTRPRHQVFLPQ